MARDNFSHDGIEGIHRYECACCSKSYNVKSSQIYSQGWFDLNTSEKTMICSVECLRKKRKKHKFNASKSECDGITFASKAEKTYYLKLKFQKQNGEVVFFLRQVAFHLPGNTKYVVDYQVFYSDGSVAFIDVKGVETPMFKLKKKQVEELYPVIIETVKMR